MTAPQKPGAKKPAQQRKPDVIVGDEVFYQHPSGPRSDHVAAHGAHGCTMKKSGHRVLWEHVLGHKKRAAQQYHIHEEGEDGMILRDRNGLRQYLAVPPEARSQGEETPMLTKSGDTLRLLLIKADGMAPRAGLTKKTLTDKNGVQTTRWVSATPDAPRAQVGGHVGWANGEHKSHGRVMAAGRDGVTARDRAGGLHQVRHEHVTHHWQGEGEPTHSPHDAAAEAAAAKAAAKEIRPHEGDPDTFSAAAFASQHNDATATADSIVDQHGPEVKAKIDAARKRLDSATPTAELHRAESGQWSEERAALHRKIIFGEDGKGGILSQDAIARATPQPGEKPVFIALGGRGGSGKSSLNGLVYDEGRAIVVDADHIKSMLPEYQGWNAHEVHEESSDVVNAVIDMAKLLGLNIVLDATMKSSGTINQFADAFKDAGYRLEAHYMHLPRQEATRRAIGRFINGGEKGRFVPPEVVMANTENEKNFDAIKSKADAWSFHDNQGGKGEGPKLIAKKGDFSTVAKQVLQKAMRELIIVTKGR